MALASAYLVQSECLGNRSWSRSEKLILEHDSTKKRSDPMRNTASRLGLIISVIGWAAMGGSAERLYPANETDAPGDEPYVEVTSVRIQPSTIHKDMEPDRAAIIVKIMLRGEAPPHSTGRVYVATYSAHPPQHER